MRASEPSDHSPHFIVGTGRCGSTLLSNLLFEGGDVLVLSELLGSMHPAGLPEQPLSGREFADLLTRPQPFTSFLLRHGLEEAEFLYPVDESRRYDRSSGVPPVLATTIPSLGGQEDLLDDIRRWAAPRRHAPVAAHYRALFGALGRRLDRPVVVERSGGSVAHVRRLATHFPEARFVHLYRRGVPCAASMMRHNLYRLGVLGIHLERVTGRNPYSKFSEDLPGVIPTELRALHPVTFDRARFDALRLPPESFGRFWSAVLATGVRQPSRLAQDRVMHVQFESLLHDPVAVVSEVRAFFGAPDRSPIRSGNLSTTDDTPSVDDHTEIQLRRGCRLGERIVEGLTPAGNT